jgi:hypothetical protein
MNFSVSTIKHLALSLTLAAPLMLSSISSSPAAASAACDAVTLARIDQVLGQIKTAQQHESLDSQVPYGQNSKSTLASAYQKMSDLRSWMVNNPSQLFSTTAPFGVINATASYQTYLYAMDTTTALLQARHWATVSAVYGGQGARQTVEDIIVANNSVESLGTNATRCYLGLEGA